MVPEKIGQLNIRAYSKEGVMSPKLLLALREVHHLNTGIYNLWSMTKSLKEGWTMKGDTKALELRKNGIVL